MANQVKFYKGTYNPAVHAELEGAIFFDTTSNTIYMDGIAYGMNPEQAGQLTKALKDIAALETSKADKTVVEGELAKKADKSVYDAKVLELETADANLGDRIDGITASVVDNKLTIKDGNGKTTNFSVDLTAYAKTADVDAKLENKSDIDHKHAIKDVTNLQEELNKKATSADLDDEIARATTAEEKAKDDAIAAAKSETTSQVAAEKAARNTAIATAKSEAIAAAKTETTDQVAAEVEARDNAIAAAKEALEAEINKLITGEGSIDAVSKRVKALEDMLSLDKNAADNAINTWNEVVNFLEGITLSEGTGEAGEITGDSLAALLKKINADIANVKTQHEEELAAHKTEYNALKTEVGKKQAKLTQAANGGDNITIAADGKISSAVYWQDV